ncbi:MAG TPA: hypothetical protein VNP97_04630 [Microbacterium sp.]|nr:hypothetical protein [Microbacterium sp.]
MTRAQITASSIIASVEFALTDDRSHSVRLRYARARERLVAHLEALDERMLTESGVAMLEVERALRPEGALLRVATAEDLLYALPGFVALDRDGLPTSDARAQLRVSVDCRNFITQRRLVDPSGHSCVSIEFDGALRRARSALRERSTARVR